MAKIFLLKLSGVHDSFRVVSLFFPGESLYLGVWKYLSLELFCFPSTSQVRIKSH